MIGLWATLISCIHILLKKPLGVANILLTVLGFVVGLALSFRSSTAYERYSDGRKAWATLAVQSRNLARYVWVHIIERPGQEEEDLLAKVTAINLILAFSVALKHKLRFEPFAHYEDLNALVGHLNTFAKAAHKEEHLQEPKKTPWKRVGEYLGLSIASSNPRKQIKRADRPLGNLPLEILTYLSSYFEEAHSTTILKSPIIYGQVMTSLAALTDTQAAAERVLTTPLPVGYNILISQIVLLYVYLLPFQLIGPLGWVTIPATFAAAYIILGLAAIGNELENPFGNDVNDLPLDHYCDELSRELDTMMSHKAATFYSQVLRGSDNKPLWPLSDDDYGRWSKRSEKDIRSALRAKVIVGAGGRFSQSSESTAEDTMGMSTGVQAVPV
jgi:predicted membrane chloride channel (bestrophin family)